jgi:hypothetical protein
MLSDRPSALLDRALDMSRVNFSPSHRQPSAARVSWSPRWLFFRLAILVTLVLWLPDLYILAKGQPPRAVAVLMVMHVAIALVTYNCLVRIAPVRGRQLSHARARHSALR